MSTNESSRTQEIEVYESVLADMTDSQLAAVQEHVAQLVGQDEAFNLCMSVMIASQQLYALARFALQRECQKEGITWQDGVEEMVIKAAKEHSLQPISRTDVLNKVQRTVLKFLTEEVDMQVQDERAEHLRLSKEAHEKRMKTTVSTPYGDFERGSVIVVTGTLPAVNEELEGCVIDGTTMWLEAKGLPNKAIPKNAPPVAHVHVGINRWSGLAKSPSNMRKVFEIYLNRLFEHKCDLVVVYNTPLLSTESVSGRSRVRTADDAIQTIRRWAADHGAVVIAGLPRLGEDASEWYEEVQKLLSEHNKIVEV